MTDNAKGGAVFAMLSFDGVTPFEARARAVALGAVVVRVVRAASGKTVHVESELNQSAKDAAAIAAYKGELRLIPMRVISRVAS